MECRIGCGACCVAPSISSPIPGMPTGKPAGVRCVQLDSKNRCKLFGSTERPVVCSTFRAEQSICGDNQEQAIRIISEWELLTRIS